MSGGSSRKRRSGVAVANAPILVLLLSASVSAARGFSMMWAVRVTTEREGREFGRAPPTNVRMDRKGRLADENDQDGPSIASFVPTAGRRVDSKL
jgi:hypothetical protein